MNFGIVGYSTRSLVQAVVELGHRAIAIDAFGDQDTIDTADEVHVVSDWPQGILTAASQLKVDGWLLAGGMENCPEVIWGAKPSDSNGKKCLAELAPVLGPTSAEMETLRSLSFCASMAGEGVHWPETRVYPPLDESSWIVKPTRSAGGWMVRSWTAADCMKTAEAAKPDYYWQRRIEGRVVGITWMFEPSGCHLHGITQSLSENEWPGPSEFIYRGSIGPVHLPAEQTGALVRLGQRLQTALPDYRGFLQADLLEDKPGRLWLLEFNPRWTAGMEVLHEAAPNPQQSPIGQHLQAWGIPIGENANTVGLSIWPRPPVELVSKAIHYAAADLELSQVARRKLQSLRNWQNSLQPGLQWCLADLPAVAGPAPMRFETGWPILTVKSRKL